MFTNIDDFKLYVGGAVNQSMELDSISPTIATAFDQYIRPWLGDTLADKVFGPDPTPDIAPEIIALRPIVKKPLALLTMYKYSKVGAIQFSETGMHRIETDNVKTAYKYQEEEYSLAMLEDGFEALETMLKYLDAHEENYNDWTSSDAYQMHNGYFLRYASELRRHYSKYVTRYAYESLRAIIEEVECFAIEGIMPPTLYQSLKDKYNQQNGSTYEKKAIAFIQKAITEFTIHEGLQRLWVRLDGDRVVHREHTSDQLRSTNTKAEGQAVSLALRHHNLMANRWINRLLVYICDNPSEFPTAFCETVAQGAEVQAQWVNSTGITYYMYKGAGNTRCYSSTDPAAVTTDPCCPDRHQEFSAAPCGSCCDGCGGKKSGVFRL